MVSPIKAIVIHKKAVHQIAVMKHIRKNAFAGMDISKIIMENVNLFAKKDINLITKLKHIAKRSVRGIIIMINNRINARHAHKIVFGSLAGINVDAMEDMKRFMKNAF